MINGRKKKELIGMIATLKKANKVMKNVRPGQQKEFTDMLAQCQDAALEIGNYLETKGEAGEKIVEILEEYCESLYQQSISLNYPKQCRSLAKKIERQLTEVEQRIRRDFTREKKEVAFLPYKASMWDSLESIWLAAEADENCNAYVVPIPYFDREQDGSLGEMHDEGDQYPDYVPITSWEEYDLSEKEPDVIYIHNPYDGGNYVTSVHPEFYSDKLREYTSQLVYVPYFIFPAAFERHFAMTSGVLYCDLMFVQNEETRKGYIKALVEEIPDITEAYWQNKIIAMGSPKTDKIINLKKEDLEVPKSWLETIAGKKVIFFNTNVSMIINNPLHIIENLNRIFETVRHCENYVIIWREHPLTVATIKSMHPEIWDSYVQIKKKFVDEKYGILDDTPEPYMAMILSDCYYGAGGSLSSLYPVTGKPILITDYKYPEQISKEKISLDRFVATFSKRMLYAERNINSLSLFLENLSVFEEQKEERISRQKIRMDNLDGHVGDRIYKYVIKEE